MRLMQIDFTPWEIDTILAIDEAVADEQRKMEEMKQKAKEAK